MKHVFIIRHGETDNNKIHRFQGRGIDASINETGREQAKAIAEALSIYPIQKVITSSLVRTIETAEPLILEKNPVVESYSDLDEMGFGDFEGSFIHEIIPEIRELQRRWEAGEVDFAIKGGESPQQVYDRASTKLIEVLSGSEDEYIAFYLHGRLIRILLAGLLDYGLEKMQEIEHQNGSINHLIWDGEKLTPVELNKTDHLHQIEVQG
jgi:probable phosphoglycerate mutase